jgi:hypothetical protein
MSIEPLNTLPIIQFLQQVKQADGSKSPEVRIPIDRAKSLAFTLGIVMTRLEGDLEKLIADSKSTDANEVVNIVTNPKTGW